METGHEGDAAPAKERLTLYIFYTCLMAGSGGLLYGYDLVIAGGISIMDDFLKVFYPDVLMNKGMEKHDNYCKYDNQVFQLFSSSLCLAALFSTFTASYVTRKLGHRSTMMGAGLLYMVGTAFGTGAINLGMLILNRVLMGCGIGFANQAIPLYLSELAPAKHRGTLNLLFSLNIAIGIFIANLVNYVSSKLHPWGWRLSLGVCAVPALALGMASLILVDTPSSLIARNENEQARAVLKKIRDSPDVDDELNELIKARQNTVELQASNQNSFKSLLQRHNRPQIIIAMAMPFFQQMTGYDAILFYGPSLFSAAGFKDDAALYSTLITGFAAMMGTFFAIYVVDRLGRKRLLLYASTIMFLCMVIIATIVGVELRGSKQELPENAGAAEVVILCFFVFAYKASWGPLAWLIPSEIFPQDIRSAGQSSVVFVNMFVKFIIAQCFLSMLCAFKFGIFLFFAVWLIIMFAFTVFLIPETKGIPIDKMNEVWSEHWLWKDYTETHAITSIEMKP